MKIWVSPEWQKCKMERDKAQNVARDQSLQSLKGHAKEIYSVENNGSYFQPVNGYLEITLDQWGEKFGSVNLNIGPVQ